MVNNMATFDHNRTYGIEIEMSWGRGNRKPSASVLANTLTRGGVPTIDDTAAYHHRTADTWKIMGDGSVTNGWELVSPILTGLNGKEQLKAAMRIVKSIGAVTHKSCGIHVHHGVRDFTAKELANVANIYANNEDVIDQLVAPSRRNNANHYCKSLKLYNVARVIGEQDAPFYDWATEIPRSDLPMVPYQAGCSVSCGCDECAKKSRLIAKLAPGGRYYKVNFHAYKRQGTVEFRQHQSSLNAIKIWDWVVFTQMVVTIAKGKRGKAKPRIINQGNVSTRKERALVRDLGMHKRIYQLDGSENYDDITMASMRRLVRRRNGMGFEHTVRFQNSVEIDDPDDSDVATTTTVSATDQHALTCDGTMVERMNRGTHERFMGCTNYRRGCRFTAQVVADPDYEQPVEYMDGDDMDLGDETTSEQD